jgi:hypothetical protein
VALTTALSLPLKFEPHSRVEHTAHGVVQHRIRLNVREELLRIDGRILIE